MSKIHPGSGPAQIQIGSGVGLCPKPPKLANKLLKDGNCSSSNNLVENSIRPFTVGRKN
ncbi:MAG TPA: transposase [Desulfitobacterium dehalogenans]|uniref:Transposase n=1 Tax=Desulfitobacterium dehalogenans TaxID=36854 RepID=A0A7C7D5G3_9FIRM|nr:transposase [Desulfitobacterium dehalogenans]